MAGKKKESIDVILLLVEGATEVEFYKKMLGFLNQKYTHKKCVFRPPTDMKGIGNFQNGAVRQFNVDATKFKKSKHYSKDSKYVYHVFMCIDTDVFEFQSNPPIDKEKVQKAIEAECGIPHYIEACHSIEDWFLEDLDGIGDFLDTDVSKKNIKGKNGAEKLDALFKVANKRYIKGTNCNGLVENLNIENIFNNHQEEFSELIELLNK